MGDVNFTPATTGILCDVQTLPTKTTKNNYLRPVNQCMWNLQPYFRIFTTGAPGEMELVKFEGRAIPNLSNIPKHMKKDGYTASWWGFNAEVWHGRINEFQQLDVFNHQQSLLGYPGEAGITADYKFLGLSGAGYPDAAGTFQMALIVSTDDNGSATYGKDANNANVANLFGFPNFSYVDQTILSTPNYERTLNTGASDFTNIVFKSTNVPVLSTGKSCFVRCPTLTHQSQNGACSGMSKILYHLPRFSDSGNDVGPLYWTPSEMVYLDLKNPSDITLNDLQIDIVDKDEKIVTDLNGNTIVALHIRKKQ